MRMIQCKQISTKGIMLKLLCFDDYVVNSQITENKCK